MVIRYVYVCFKQIVCEMFRASGRKLTIGMGLLLLFHVNLMGQLTLSPHLFSDVSRQDFREELALSHAFTCSQLWFPSFLVTAGAILMLETVMRWMSVCMTI